jgi:hypothetical protein
VRGQNAGKARPAARPSPTQRMLRGRGCRRGGRAHAPRRGAAFCGPARSAQPPRPPPAQVDSGDGTAAVNFWWASPLSEALQAAPRLHHYYLRLLQVRQARGRPTRRRSGIDFAATHWHGAAGKQGRTWEGDSGGEGSGARRVPWRLPPCPGVPLAGLRHSPVPLRLCGTRPSPPLLHVPPPRPAGQRRCAGHSALVGRPWRRPAAAGGGRWRSGDTSGAGSGSTGTRRTGGAGGACGAGPLRACRKACKDRVRGFSNGRQRQRRDGMRRSRGGGASSGGDAGGAGRGSRLVAKPA